MTDGILAQQSRAVARCDYPHCRGNEDANLLPLFRILIVLVQGCGFADRFLPPVCTASHSRSLQVGEETVQPRGHTTLVEEEYQ